MMMYRPSSFALSLVVVCLFALVSFPRAARACSEPDQETCNQDLEACVFPYETNMTTNGSICDCYAQYKVCTISASCQSDQIVREAYSAECTNAGCPGGLCFWGAASTPSHWIHAFADLISNVPASSLLDGASLHLLGLLALA